MIDWVTLIDWMIDLSKTESKTKFNNNDYS